MDRDFQAIRIESDKMNKDVVTVLSGIIGLGVGVFFRGYAEEKRAG